ncbi:MAG TPA: Crp/Fnr family transcriptional regulator [Burkholderiaceae bacterium]|nr:Crp/Fnr family transcriptional regulator [Burkholderiaceae bacterium]
MSTEVQPSILGLRGIQLLDGLSTERLEALARECAWRRYEPGQLIISRNGPEREVYLIIGGRVRITFYSAAGRQVTFRDEEAGAILGDVAAVDDGPRSADAVALDAVLIASLPPANFKRLLQQEPVVAERFMRRLTGLIRLLSERVIELSTLGVQHRIHAELLRLARLGAVDGNVARVAPAPKHADIASQVSTYREQVTREMSALTKAGLLGKEPGALLITDLSRLEQLVVESRT